jgi:hypothetical protein
MTGCLAAAGQPGSRAGQPVKGVRQVSAGPRCPHRTRTSLPMCLPRIESRTVHTPITEVAGSRPIGMPIYQNHIFAFDDPDALAEAFAGPGGAFL